MGRPALEVADIFRIHGPAYRKAHGHAMSSAQRRVMRAIEICRTAVLGGHVDQCDRCGHQRISYNSCAKRHCNKCQSLAWAKWLAKHRVFDDEETIQDSKSEGRHGEEVHGRDDFAVIAQESSPEFPCLLGRRQAPDVARNVAFRDLEAKLEKFTMNPGSAPTPAFALIA